VSHNDWHTVAHKC